MRFLKLFIAAVLVLGLFFGTSPGARGAEVSDDNKLVPEQQDTPVTIGDLVVAKLDVSDAARPASGAVSSEEPAQAALRLTPAIPGGEPFTSPVTLPAATPAPEPGAAVLGAAGAFVLRRRRRA